MGMMTDHEQVECYKCQVWIDDFQSKVIDGDDYCCECAYIAIFNKHAKLKREYEKLKKALFEACHAHPDPIEGTRIMIDALTDTQEKEVADE